MEIRLGLLATLLLLLLMSILEAEAGEGSNGRFSLDSNYTKQIFDWILSNATNAPLSYYEGRRFYSYTSFIAAAASFPGFGTTGSSDVAGREVAAFLANADCMTYEFCSIHETNMVNRDLIYKGGRYVGNAYCDLSSTIYPCAKGESYYGRGPLQLTWNYNYGAAGKYLKLNLLQKPDMVSTNATISFQTAIWIWMMNSNCHTAIVSGQGFGETLKSLDSRACNDPAQLKSTVDNYKAYCSYFGIDAGSNLDSCNSEAAVPARSKTIPPGIRRNSRSLFPVLLGSIGGTFAVLSFLLFFAYLMRVRWRKRYLTADGDFGGGEESTLFCFDYELLREVTKGFDARNKLGGGGFGQVYKGVLPDGTPVAVKKLFPRLSTQAVNEFHSEIKAISGVLHRNILRLLGYCTQGQEHLLVYEFMPKRSLDIHLFGVRGIFLKWEARFQIITGTARGLAYLHEHSRVCIVHRDIKPANILLDENLHPKIADFGMVKLFPEDKTHITTKVGGTIGYTAPEYAVHGHLTQKADVYSYGVVVLEIVSGRKCVDATLSSPILLQWAWSLYERNEIMNVVDPKLEVQGMSENEERQRQVLRVICIALLCVQGFSSQRPSMSNVLSMLTSDSEILLVPTAPTLIDCEHISLSPAPTPDTASALPSSSTSHSTMSYSPNIPSIH